MDPSAPAGAKDDVKSVRERMRQLPKLVTEAVQEAVECEGAAEGFVGSAPPSSAVAPAMSGGFNIGDGPETVQELPAAAADQALLSSHSGITVRAPRGPAPRASARQLLPKGFPSDGVTIEALEELAAAVDPSWTTNEVCMLHVKPTTVPHGWKHVPRCTSSAEQWYAHSYVDTTTGHETEVVPPGTVSYCDVLRSRGKGQWVGRAEIFVSHAWKYKFCEVVAALRSETDAIRSEPGFDGRDLFLWFDIVTINEHTGVDPDIGDWAGVFKTAVAAFGHTLLVLAPWQDPVVLTRSWCLWEIYCTVSAGARLSVCMGTGEQDRFLAALVGNRDAISAALAHIDSAKAEVSSPADKLRIDAAILRDVPGGFAGLNGIVFDEIRPMFLSYCRARAEAVRAAAGGLTTTAALDAAAVTADVLDIMGDHAQAAEIFVEVLAAAAEVYSTPNSPNALAYKVTYAIVLTNADRLIEAAELAQELIAAFTPLFGEHGVETCRVIDIHATVLAKQRRFDEAGRLYRHVMGAHAAALAGASAAAAGGAADAKLRQMAIMAKGNYAAMLVDQGGHDEDMLLLQREVLAEEIASRGAQHVIAIDAKNNLAAMLHKLGRHAEAEPLMDGATKSYSSVLGADHHRTCDAHAALALIRTFMRLAKVGVVKNPQSAWAFYHETAGGRGFYMVPSSTNTATLRVPIEGVSGAIVLTAERFNGPHAMLARRKQMEDAGLANPASPWRRLLPSTAHDGQALYVCDAMGTVTLDVPAEGVCDESVVADAVFDQHYQPLAKRNAQIDAGLLSTSSAWIKYTSASGTFYVHPEERIRTADAPAGGVGQIAEHLEHTLAGQVRENFSCDVCGLGNMTHHSCLVCEAAGAGFDVCSFCEGITEDGVAIY